MKLFENLNDINEEFIKDLVHTAIEKYVYENEETSEEVDGFDIEVDEGHYVQKNCLKITISKNNDTLKEFCIPINYCWCSSPDVMAKYR